MGKLVIDGNSVYEIDEECIRRRESQQRKQEVKGQDSGQTSHRKPQGRAFP